MNILQKSLYQACGRAISAFYKKGGGGDTDAESSDDEDSCEEEELESVVSQSE